MDDSDDLLTERIAEGCAAMIRACLDELRKQGRINGELSIVVKDGRKEIRLPFPSDF